MDSNECVHGQYPRSDLVACISVSVFSEFRVFMSLMHQHEADDLCAAGF